MQCVDVVLHSIELKVVSGLKTKPVKVQNGFLAAYFMILGLVKDVVAGKPEC